MTKFQRLARLAAASAAVLALGLTAASADDHPIKIGSVLAVLEISLSFDNAVVNATVLREMDEKWQRRFLTWGILIAVFGMRIVFPLAIVAIAANLDPLSAIHLSLNDPERYEAIVSSAHVGIAGFGGAFLAMVGLSFFFDGEKDVDWIRGLELALRRFSEIKAAEIGILLLLLYGISTMLPDADAMVSDTASFRIVDCPHCGGMLKPDIVYFGESVPKARVDQAYSLVDAADALLVAGSDRTPSSGPVREPASSRSP